MNNFDKYIDLSVSDFWYGVELLGLTLENGHCTPVDELAHQTLDASSESFHNKTAGQMVSIWKKSAHAIVQDAKCMGDARVSCAMKWTPLEGGHNQLEMTDCDGKNADLFNTSVVVEIIPTSDSHVLLMRTR